jgi:hypothetical protein
MREFLVSPAEARDRDVEYNDSVAVPLLELELQALLSGGRGNTSTTITVAKEANSEAQDTKHDH